MSLAPDGTMKFLTSNTPLPPTVEVVSLQPETMGAATLTAKLVSRDLSLPTVRIYYGDEDGGFDSNNWDSFVDVDSGNQVNLGEFNATISGLNPGTTYYFRAFANSPDGSDWSSGDRKS